MSDAPLPEVLAGPFLRHTTPTEAYVWLATSIPLNQRDILVEFWDPAPYKHLPIQNKPSYSLAGGAATVWPSSEVQSLQVAPCLYANLVRTRFTRRLRSNKVYAYRVVLHPLREHLDEPEPHAEEPPGGALERLAPLGPTEAKQSFASFVLGQPTNFWTWGLPSQAVTQLTAAGVRLQTMVQHDPGDKPGAARLPKPAPNAAFFFGNPWTFGPIGPNLSEMAFNAILRLARDLAGPSPLPFDWYKAVYAAAYLLAWSPTLWHQRLPPPLPPSATLTDEESLGAAVEATACIMANTPSYVLGTSNAAAVLTERATEGARSIAGGVLGALARGASIFVNAAFADWANAPDSVTSFDLLALARAVSTSDASLVRSFVVPQQPAIGCAAAGDSIAKVLADNTNTGTGAEKDHQAISDRVPTVVSVDPVLRRTDGATREPHAVVKQHDITLVVSFTGGRAFIAESGQRLGDPPAATFAPSGDGSLHGKVLEVAASPGGAPESHPRRKLGEGVEVKVHREVPDARYASLWRAGGSVTMSLEPATSDAATVTVTLPAHGRLVPVASPHDGLHLGNRFWNPEDPTSPPALRDGDRKVAFLEGVQANIYQTGVARRVSGGTANRDGHVDLSVDGLADGEYTLAIEGDGVTFDHAGPDTPVTNGHRHFKDRVWLRQKFPIRIAGQRIETIDGEPVPGAKYRLLIDPVWMHSARAIWRENRKVTLILLHRTDDGGPGAGDAATNATRWQYEGEDGKGAHYLLARDGTLVKCADESESIGHAGKDHLTRWTREVNSSWQQAQALNSFSIGVEISKQETWERYTDKQYAALLRLLRRFRNPSRGDVDVLPTEIVGHSDIRLQKEHPNQLGDRNDPGLAFDWTRLERRHLGLRRNAQEDEALFDGWPEPPTEVVEQRDEFNAQEEARRQAGADGLVARYGEAPTKTWESEVQKAVQRYDTKYPPATLRSKIREDVRDALERIGYYAPSTGDEDNFKSALQAFRSHFFSGPRRGHFQNKVDKALVWSTEEERSAAPSSEQRKLEQWKLSVIWALEVAEYAHEIRARASAAAAWQDALHDEQNEKDPATKP